MKRWAFAAPRIFLAPEWKLNYTKIVINPSQVLVVLVPIPIPLENNQYQSQTREEIGQTSDTIPNLYHGFDLIDAQSIV